MTLIATADSSARRIGASLEEQLYGRDPEGRVRELRAAILGEPQTQMTGLLAYLDTAAQYAICSNAKDDGSCGDCKCCRRGESALTPRTLAEAHALLVQPKEQPCS